MELLIVVVKVQILTEFNADNFAVSAFSIPVQIV